MGVHANAWKKLYVGCLVRKQYNICPLYVLDDNRSRPGRVTHNPRMNSGQVVIQAASADSRLEKPRTRKFLWPTFLSIPEPEG